MGKINAYQPRQDFKSYLYPTAKPYKSGAIGYQQRVWTLEDQIYFHLKKIAHFIDLLFEKSTNIHKKQVAISVKKNIEVLHKDLELLKKSLQKKLIDIDKKKLKINDRWISEMKTTCDNFKNLITDTIEVKILHKLRHMLNELEHLIKPKLHGIQKGELLKVPVKKKEITVARKPTRRAAVETKTLAPVKKRVIKTKVKVGLKKSKPIKKVKVSKVTKIARKPVKKVAVATKKVALTKKRVVKTKVAKIGRKSTK